MLVKEELSIELYNNKILNFQKINPHFTKNLKERV